MSAWYPMSAMSYFRALSATLLSAATTFSLVSASGCGTSAVGVGECRDIEQARCRAGKSCGLIDDVEACERYYRDHCLHGLAVKPPGGGSVSECVRVIEAAGQCAAENREARLSSCETKVTNPRRDLVLACDVVAHPERATECAFLTNVPIGDDGAAGASAGGANSSGASDSDAGQPGAPGTTMGGAAAQ